MKPFNPVLFFVNLMAYAVLMGVAPWAVFAIMNATDNRPPVLLPNARFFD